MISNRFCVCMPFMGSESIGGSHISAALLARELIKRGIDVRMVVHKVESEVERFFIKKGLRIIVLPLPRFGSKRMAEDEHSLPVWAIFKLLRYIKRQNISLVHTHSFRVHFVWALACQLSGIKHIWHVRGYFPSKFPGRFKLLFSHAFISISRYVSSGAPFFIRRRVFEIDNPFDSKVFPAGTACRRKLLLDCHVQEPVSLVLFGGRLDEPRKRALFFAQVSKLVRIQTRIPVAFLVFGEGSEQTVRAMREIFGLDDECSCLRFLGFRDPLHEVMSAADIVVCPAVDEPFGRLLVEAMLAGTTVIASRSGAHPEIVEHEKTGFLVDADNVEQMQVAIIKLLQDGAVREQLAKNGWAYAQGRFAVEKHVDQVLSIYRNVLSAGN